MGTSGAYGGSGGWDGTRRDTGDWLSGGSASGAGGSSSDPGGTTPDGPQPPPEEGPDQDTSQNPNQVNPAIARILAGVTGKLSNAVGGYAAAGPGDRRTSGAGGRSAGGGGRSGRARAAASGGAAIAGVYGLQRGDAGALADVGLSVADLEGLSPFEQASRIVDAASGPYVPLEEDELREVNAEFVWRALESEEAASPVELVKAWVTELVFHTWLTEAGSVLRDGTRDGAITHALEREVRVTLEAAVARIDLPAESLRANDFQQAVGTLLGTLSRIFGEAAA